MTAIILAGGFGTRLQSVVKDVPKPMADINGKPFLEYIIQYLSTYKITEIVLSVGYKQEIIKNYFKDKYNDILIKYSCENTPLGTGGAIKQAIKISNSEKILVLNGDTFFQVDLSKLMKITYDYDIVLSLKKMKKFDRYGAVKLKDKQVVGFEEKRFFNEGFINCGVYLIHKTIFDKIKKPDFSFEDFLQKNLHLNIYSYIDNDAYFIDIGIPKDYKQTKIDFKELF